MSTSEQQPPVIADAPPSSASVEPSLNAAPPAPSEAPGLTAEQIAELQQKASAYDQVTQTLSPYRDDIVRLVEDQKFRDFNKQSWEAYQHLQQQQQPQIAPEFKPIVDKLDSLESFVNEQRQAQRAQQQVEEQKWINENADYAKRLIATEGLNQERVIQLGMYADTLARAEGRRVGLEEAYKRVQSFAKAEAQPPRSLRSDAGAPGVPGKSTQTPDPTRLSTDFAGVVRDALASSGRQSA